MLKPFLMIVFFCFINNASYALQVKHAINNEAIVANVSATDITRVFVYGDRIQSVRGVKGTYTHENDNKSGEIYIQPTPNYQHQPFTLLVNTEAGHHYTLRLIPNEMPSDALMLMPQGVQEKQAVRFEKYSPYELTLAHFIRSMAKGIFPEGYVVREVDHPKHYIYCHHAEVKLKTVYQGTYLKGEVWEISNNQSAAVLLNMHDFYKSGALAISIRTNCVMPHSKVNLYRVLNNV